MNPNLARAKELMAEAMKLTATAIPEITGSQVRDCVVQATNALSTAISAIDNIPRAIVYQRESDLEAAAA